MNNDRDEQRKKAETVNLFINSTPAKQDILLENLNKFLGADKVKEFQIDLKVELANEKKKVVAPVDEARVKKIEEAIIKTAKYQFSLTNPKAAGIPPTKSSSAPAKMQNTEEKPENKSRPGFGRK